MVEIYQPFRTDDALRAGISKRRLAGTEFQRLFRGCHVSAERQIGLPLRAMAAITTLGAGDFACHHTAAKLYGAVVPDSCEVHLGVVGEMKRVRRDGIRTHRFTWRPALVSVAGVPMTTPEQTFLDLAAELDLVDLVILADSLIHKRRTSTQRLEAAAAQFRGRGARSARRAVELARAGSESPNETRVRLLMHFAGLPEPTLNPVITDHQGRKRRPDLAYLQAKIAIEFDGKYHLLGGEKQWKEDNDRRADLTALGWRFVVINGSDLFTKPDAVLRRILDAMRLAEMPVPRLDPSWRRYFG